MKKYLPLDNNLAINANHRSVKYIFFVFIKLKSKNQIDLNRFPEHLESGLLEVISPPESFYPDMDKLKQTLGDPMERVRYLVATFYKKM